MNKSTSIKGSVLSTGTTLSLVYNGYPVNLTVVKANRKEAVMKSDLGTEIVVAVKSPAAKTNKKSNQKKIQKKIEKRVKEIFNN